MIDPHVHLRDWNQTDKETLRHAFAVAARCGIDGLFEMPNTDPPLTDDRAIRRRIAEADRTIRDLGLHLFHGLYAGITADPAQLGTVVSLHRELFPRVVGLKLYAGHSTGRMGVITREDQKIVWDTLGPLDYRGVVAIHAETEELLKPQLWDPTHPISHGRARPPEAEAHSIAQQIALADEAGFSGAIHICHITTPEGLDEVTRARRSRTVRVGVTPHHLLLNEEVALHSRVPEWRVNPPLRDERRRQELWDRLVSGEIDWIESDHAPHTWSDKVAGAAGLPGIPAFRLLRDRLIDLVGTERTTRLTGSAVIEAFGIERFVEREGEVPPFDYRSMGTEYPWDPYRFLS
ncbi:MAG: dihydroorotase [Alkalispirochaeta sp.]